MQKLALPLFLASALSLSGQIVFQDDMSGTFSSNWASASTNVGVGSFSSGQLLLDNGGDSGQTYAFTQTSSFGGGYNTTLASNSGEVTWSFNMGTLSAGPSNSNRLAFVIAADSSDFTSAEGYAVRVGGNSPSVDPLELIHFSGGVNGTIVEIASGGSMTDTSSDFANVRVTYNPSGNSWTLFGSTVSSSGSWSDPTGESTLLGSGTNSSVTATGLGFMGVWSLHTTAASQDRVFDNITVSAVPEPSTYAALTGIVILGFAAYRRRNPKLAA